MSSHLQGEGLGPDVLDSSTVQGVQSGLPSASELVSRNLRLLNLDLRRDWPGLTEDTFTPHEDSRLRAKARYKHAEWVLYRLFQLWDAQKSEDHLEVFFPSMEPIQSIRLRSSMYLLLEELKRDGILPRGCPLRKSLLDDCIGPKFVELLLAFSTVVLQKHVRGSHRPLSPVVKLASEQELQESNVDQLVSLGWSLQGSLTSKLVYKHIHRQRLTRLHGEFSVRNEYFELLQDCNSTAMGQYSKALNESSVDCENLKRAVRNGTVVNPWANVAMSGEVHADRDSLTETERFDDIWRRAQAGAAPEGPREDRKSLLACLDDLKAAQSQRLERLRRFQSNVSRRNGELVVIKSPINSPRKTPRRPLQSSPSKSNRRKSSDAQPMSLRNKNSRRPSDAQQRSQIASLAMDSDTTKDVQAASQQLERALFKQKSSQRPMTTSAVASGKGAQMSSQLRSGNAELDDGLQDYQPVSDIHHHTHTGTPALSLAQRTRESMAFTSQRPLRRKQGFDADVVMTPLKGSNEETSSLTEAMAHISLAERAQQSMSQLQRSNSARQPTKPGSHRKSQSHQLTRKPAFPVNPFADGSPQRKSKFADETPRIHAEEAGSPPNGDTSGAAMYGVVEADDDASVFKPRRKLRMSPPGGSPIRLERTSDEDQPI